MVIQKDDLINVLETWNYWDKNVINVKNREEYEKKIRRLRETKEVIVLKGIRRSGKSSLLNLEINNLLKKIKKENILFVNFEEPKFMNYLNTDFLDHIFSTYKEYLEPKGKAFIFLDEVQNVFGWEKWVLRMYEKENVQIYVTGSSSKLLSSEFSTALSGRHISVNVQPLSFFEFLKFNNVFVNTKKDFALKKNIIRKKFNEFLKWGGFPKIVELKDELNKKSELISYYDTIILKDVASRHNISHVSDLKKLSFYLISNIGKFYSVNKLKEIGLGSYDTIKKYIDFLKESYLLYDLELYDVSVKKQLVNPKKTYIVDTGLVNAVSFRFSEDKGRLLENLVFNELRKKELEIFYHKRKKECDFIIKEGTKIIQAIQVSLFLNDYDTKKREIDGLVDALKTYNLKEGLILTLDEEEILSIENKKIKVLPVWKWLLV